MAKFTFELFSSLGHEVTSQETDTSVEFLQDNFREAVRVLEQANRRELGEREYLYLEYTLTEANELEQKLFDVFVKYYEED